MAITLGKIKEQALAKADMLNSNFRTNTQLNYMVNTSLQELYDLLVLRYEDYFIQSYTFTVDDNSGQYTINEPIYKVRGIDYDEGGNYYALKTFSFTDRNVKGGSRRSLRYRHLGSNIELIPAANANGSYRIWYVPRCPELIDDTQQIAEDLEQYIDYVVIDVGIKLLQMEESDPSVLMAQKQAITTRIQAAASNRGEQMTITNVNDERGFELW